MAARPLPNLDAIPIPADVEPGPGWCAMMREMAGHIGARATLAIVERHGGESIYIPADASRNPFLPLIGAQKARALSWVYRRETITIPTARYALARVRRAGVLAAVRAGDITVGDAARVLGIRRDYASKLVNQSDEGTAAQPITRPARDTRQIDMFRSEGWTPVH
jgi:hypothetical protein